MKTKPVPPKMRSLWWLDGLLESVYGCLVILGIPFIAHEIDNELVLLIALCGYLPFTALLWLAASSKLDRSRMSE